MISIETISIVFTGLSISIAAFYYINTLRNAQKTQQLQLETRQAQLYMQEFRDLNEPSRWEEYINATRSMKWTDYEDFHNKYGINNPKTFAKLWTLWFNFGTAGVLMHEGLLDKRLTYLLMGPLVTSIWEKFKPIIERERIERNLPDAWSHFEYCGEEMIRLRNEGITEWLIEEFQGTRT